MNHSGGEQYMTDRIQNPQQLCSAIRQLALSERRPLTARPWNMHEPQDSLWWLVPSAEWPAFKYAKLFFEWTDDDRQTLWAGLNVEKGVGPTAHPVCAPKNRMFDDWAWHDFLEDVGDGTLDRTLGEIATGPSVQWRMQINSGIVKVTGEVDPLEAEFRKSRARYGFVRDSVSGLWRLESQDDPKRLTLPLAKIQRTQDLVMRYAEIRDVDWLWTDLYIGCHLPLEGAPPQLMIDATAIWLRVLQRFERWLLG
jgi:hypothetical protein